MCRSRGPSVVVTLEQVARRDTAAFFAMVREYHRELDTYDPATIERPWDHARYEAAVRADMEGRDLLWILDGDERAGFAMLRTLPDWPDETRTVATIVEFYVAPSFRRRGIGTAAVEALLAEQRRRGTDEVEAGILRDNAPALAFWERLGFTVRFVQTARRP